MIVHRMSCMLWNSTRSSRQDAGGRTGDGGRRVSLETISPPIRSGPSFPHYMCQWARRLSRVKLAVILWRSICGYIPVPSYLQRLHTRYQVSQINIWHHAIYIQGSPSGCVLCEIPGVTPFEKGHAGNTTVATAYLCWVKHCHRSGRTGVPADYCY